MESLIVFMRPVLLSSVALQNRVHLLQLLSFPLQQSLSVPLQQQSLSLAWLLLHGFPAPLLLVFVFLHRSVPQTRLRDAWGGLAVAETASNSSVRECCCLRACCYFRSRVRRRHCRCRRCCYRYSCCCSSKCFDRLCNVRSAETSSSLVLDPSKPVLVIPLLFLLLFPVCAQSSLGVHAFQDAFECRCRGEQGRD